MSRTISVAELTARVNKCLAIPDEHLFLTRPDGTEYTPAQIMRRAVASLLESILMDTDNYRGFGYQDGVVDFSGEQPAVTGDESRRVYYCRY